MDLIIDLFKLRFATLRKESGKIYYLISPQEHIVTNAIGNSFKNNK